MLINNLMVQNTKNSSQTISSVFVKSTDFKYSFNIEKGRTNITIPVLHNCKSNLVLFTIILNSKNNILLRTYNYCPIKLINYDSKESIYKTNALITLNDVSLMEIQPLMPNISIHFYFEIIFFSNKEAISPEAFPLKNENEGLFEQTQESDLRENEGDDSCNKVLCAKRRRDLQCIICFETSNETYFSYLNTCKHQFCTECISNWAKSSSQCPICKKNYSKLIPCDSSSSITTKKIKKKRFRYIEEEGDEWIENVAENCMICDKGDNNYLMLVCDKCQYNICHTYCAGLEYIPENDWYCRNCKKKNKKNKENKNPQNKKGLYYHSNYANKPMKLRSQDKKNTLRRK